jgi:outer membrane protein
VEVAQAGALPPPPCCAWSPSPASQGRIFRLIAAAGLFLSLPAQAETLTDALVRAYQDNPQLQAERAQLRATDENVPQALSNWRPTVTVQATQGVVHNSSKLDCGKAPAGLFGSAPDCSYNALNNFQNLWPQSYGLSISQPIYRGGRTVAQTHQALNQVRAETANLTTIEQNVLSAVIADYTAVLLYQTIVDLSVANQQALHHELESAQSRYKSGELTRTDVAEASAAYAQALVSRQSAETQLSVDRASYEHDVGAPPGRLAAPSGLPALPPSRADTIDSALGNNPAVLQALYTEAAALDNVDAIAGQGLPSLSLQASIDRAKEETQSGLRTDSGEVLAVLSVPIYQGGAIYSGVRQAKQLAAQNMSQLDDARRAAVASGSQAWDALEGTRKTLALLRLAVDANDTARTGAEREARTGDRGTFEIITEQQNLYQTQVALVQAQHDEIVDVYTVLQAVGRLTARDLKLPVSLYQPDLYLDEVRDPDWAPLPGNIPQ